MKRPKLLRNSQQQQQPAEPTVQELLEMHLGHPVPDPSQLILLDDTVEDYRSSDEIETVRIGDRIWFQIGSGYIAEFFARSLHEQLPGSELRLNALDEWLLYHEGSAAVGYENISVHMLIDVGDV